MWGFSWRRGIFRVLVGVAGGAFELLVAVSIWRIVVSGVVEAVGA